MADPPPPDNPQLYQEEEDPTQPENEPDEEIPLPQELHDRLMADGHVPPPRLVPHHGRFRLREHPRYLRAPLGGGRQARGGRERAAGRAGEQGLGASTKELNDLLIRVVEAEADVSRAYHRLTAIEYRLTQLLDQTVPRDRRPDQAALEDY